MLIKQIHVSTDTAYGLMLQVLSSGGPSEPARPTLLA